MLKIRTFLLNLCLFAAFVGLAGCSGRLAGLSLPSLMDSETSPRATTVMVMERTISVLDKVSAAAAIGALPDQFVEDIGTYAPDVEAIAIRYLDETAACVVIDGRLQSDVASGKTCEPSALKRAVGDLSDLLWNGALRVGVDTDTGRAMLVASIAFGEVKPAAGNVIDGYAKDPDIPLGQFQAMRLDLRNAADRLLAVTGNAKVIQIPIDRLPVELAPVVE